MVSTPSESRASGEIVEVVDQPREVADAVAVRVGEAAWVDLVDHAVPPPSIRSVKLGGGR